MNWKIAFFVLALVYAITFSLFTIGEMILLDLNNATTPEEICKILAWDGKDFRECMESYK